MLHRNSSLCARWLGRALREMREQRELTLKDASAHLVRDTGSISRFENGRLAPKPADVGALLDLYRVEDPATREAFDLLTRDAWSKHWWDTYTGTVSTDVLDYVWLENRSESIRTYEICTVPALLQTRDYTEALIRAADTGDDTTAGDGQIRKQLELHTRRQQILDRHQPIRLSVIVDEAVLRRPVSGARVMAAQLAHLIDQAEDPDVDLRVLPFQAGAHAGTSVPSFRLHTMANPIPLAACIDNPHGPYGPLILTSADRLPETYERLWNVAMTDDQSAELIAAAEKTFRTRPREASRHRPRVG